MSGVTLPAIPGAYPSSVRSLPLGLGLGLGNNHGSRPSSSGSGSTSFTLAPNVYYDNCLFRSPSRTGTSRSMTKFPSLRPGRTSHVNNDVRSRYSAKYRSTPDMRQRLSANSPFLPKTATEDCLKCLLKVPHKKCESHKYIRVGGGYRHGYWYVKCLLEELELQRQRELIMKQRLESIREKQMKAIKTYIRTKSGRIVEKIIFLSEEDYEAFKEGKNVEELLKKYLSKDEAKGLQSWDKDEVKAIKTMVRTKSGRLVEKLVYVSKEDYDAITAGKVDAKELLKKYAKDGEVIEGWKEAAMKTIKTYVRTKSGRIIEKTIMISQEDYDAMIKEGKNPDEILKKYITLEEGQQLESWKSAEPMKAIKTKIRTKSGRIIEKTIYVSADDYDKMMQGGGDPNEILKKYMGEEEGTIEGWSKADPTPMKVVKTYVRTKSGRLIEKVVMLTEDEYKQFVEAGGDPEFLKKFIQLEKGEVIDSWEKASTVYSGGSDHEMIQKAKVGERIVGKDGAVYEIVVDPLTGKKYKKKIESDVDSGIASMQKGKKGKKGKGGKGGEFDSDEETPEERRRRKAGGRNPDSDGSAYSYKSVVSAGGTRHVRRRRKRADGTYSDSASYHSSQDEEGQARRRRRRRERKHGPDSANSYYSVVSEGGTRHVKRRRRRGDGTYSRSVSYHSSDSGKEGGRLADKKKKKRREHGPDSDYSYESEVSAGGTRTRKRKKKIRDAKGNVIGYGSSESYTSDDESVYTTVSDGKGGKIRVKKEKPGRGGKGGKGGGGKGGKGKKKLEPVFSDCTTDDDDVDLENMTEEEKKAYFKAKAERAAAREKRRREKYGDKYDEMMSKHQDYKKAKAKEKMKAKRLQELREQGLISPSSDWTIDSDTGEPLRKAEKAKVEQEKKRKKLQELREKGLISPSSDWTIGSDGEPARISDLIKQGKRKAEDYKKGGKGRRGKGKDGNDADDESDSGESAIDSITGERIRRKKRTGSEAEYEYEYDEQGRVIRKTRKGHKPGDEGSDYEYEYDSDGNVKMTKKKGVGVKKGKKGEDDSDEEQFEVGPDGKIRLKKGKKKIDIDKLTADDLRKLGIDPNLSKEEIAKKLQEKFGDDVKIFQGKKKIPTKRASEYGSDARSSDLAKDSDLDVDTLVGTKRVNVKMKKGGQALIDHMKSILNMSELKDAESAKDLDEKGDIDFVSHYRLVDPSKIEGYARAFVVEDDDMDQVLSYKESRTALNGIPTIQQMTTKQLEYVLKVLNLDDASQLTFRMFAVVSALCERVTSMDSISKHLLEICDLLDIQRKMDLYKAMFYCNVESDRTSNFIKADSLRIELIAGGLNWKQQEHVMARLHPNVYNEISFLDYLVYVPLFLSMHDNIVDNPLDMSDQKYNQKLRQLSGGTRQRDMNPLGMPLKKSSTFQLRKQAQDLIEGKIDPKKIKDEKVELLNKYATLPNILEENESKRKLSVPTKSATPPMQMVY